ncbi:PAS domain S-box-containing protein [Fodinibius roseus]|uniref:histidine kinase n=2 Tax=Fodinibius roseus TaxID=1194090 RepID=A0A1M4Z1G6_9BACT|nr:PAS domain S-box-containing protein [Fodinibius roseus]
MLSLTIKDLGPRQEVPKLLEFLKEQKNAFDDAGIWRHQAKDGQDLYVNIMSHPIKTEEKKCELIVARDVTKQVKTEAKHREEQQILDLLTEKLPGTFYLFDTEGNMLRWNDYTEEVTGYTSEEISDMNVLDFFAPQDRPIIASAIQQVLRKGYTELEGRLKDKSGSHIPLYLKASRVQMKGKDRILGIGIDISSLRETQNKLEEANEKLNTAQRIAKMGYWAHNLIENESEWSEEVYNIWEVDPDTLEPSFESLLETIHPEDRELFLRDVEEAFPDEDFYDSEHRIITPEGKVKWILERITLNRDENGKPLMLEGIAQDITEKKKHEQAISESLEEKDTLLAEIHHRVKNNLAIISGLMELEAMESDSGELKQRLRDSQTRINSIALTHEILYQQQHFARIEFGENIKRLVVKTVKTFNGNVELRYDTASVELNINQALPCALIVNELVTNALKHAFYGGNGAVLEIELYSENEEVYLRVSDNGKGLPENIDVENPKTLGMQLVDTLKDQLDAELNISTGNGTTFELRFKKTIQKELEALLKVCRYRDLIHFKLIGRCIPLISVVIIVLELC